MQEIKLCMAINFIMKPRTAICSLLSDGLKAVSGTHTKSKSLSTLMSWRVLILQFHSILFSRYEQLKYLHLTDRTPHTCFILARSLRVFSSFRRSFLFPTRMIGTLGQKCFTSGVHFSEIFSVPRERKKRLKYLRKQIESY